MLRHHRSGTKYIFRRFFGNCDVYKELLTIASPNLPQVYEVAQHGEENAVLEEYVQGDTLDFLLEKDVLSPRQARNITRQLCSALWVLHSRGAVHRDIKPDNVILRGDEAVLIDFDASRIFKDEAEGDTRVLGTLGYAAPEQFGIAQSDERADIYALGVLLNVMLTGKHPSKKLATGFLGRVVQKCTMTNPDFVGNTFRGNDTAVLLTAVPGDTLINFEGTTFSGNKTDIDNPANCPTDVAGAVFD